MMYLFYSEPTRTVLNIPAQVCTWMNSFEQFCTTPVHRIAVSLQQVAFPFILYCFKIGSVPFEVFPKHSRSIPEAFPKQIRSKPETPLKKVCLSKSAYTPVLK